MTAKQKILVIEDNDFVRMQIVKFLQAEDKYDILEAQSSEDGMRHVHKESQTIHCMLVDIRMEPEDGFDFLHKIRAEGINTPVILVTGDQNPDILTTASSMGVVSVLMKPINKDRLVKMVDRAISHRVGSS